MVLQRTWQRTAALTAFFLSALLYADEPTPPDRREIWVPTDQLSTVLGINPNAVLLSREQYETLLREAQTEKPEVPPAPREAVLASANYAGKIDEDVLSVSGVLSVQVLTDEWTKLPLTFGKAKFGSVRIGGPAALSPPDKEGDSVLLLRGKGERQIIVEFSVPILHGEDGTETSLQLPRAGATRFEVDLPAQTEAKSDQPVRLEKLADRTHITATLGTSNALMLTWNPLASALGAMSAKAAAEIATTYVIDAERVHATVALELSAPVGVLPAALELTVPAETTILHVTGPELEGWSVAAGVLTVKLQPGDRTETSLEVQLQQPSLAGAAEATVRLPHLVPRTAGGISHTATLKAGAGVALRQIVNPAAEPLPPGNDSATAARWTAEGGATPATVFVQRLRPRFHADLDALVEFKTDAVHLQRTITLHEQEGRVFTLVLTLPAGEEVLDLVPAGADQRQIDWRREGNRLILRWTRADQPGDAPPVIKLLTRSEPAGWAAAAAAAPSATQAPIAFDVPDLKIEGAERVTGYMPLRAESTFRLEVEASDTLERRDGRITPVRGEYAWFRRGDFTLRVKIARRPGELLASVTGYALPLAGVLDLRAQIAWDFRYAGVRSVQVRVPEAVASHFNFESPQIASRTLTADTWTITFQSELTGPQVLAVDAQIPISRPAEDQSHFTAEVPVIEPLGVQRVAGTWAIEANTDTEITVAAPGMNELDALLAPALAGYAPRHRVIGVYTWLGPKYSLSLAGTRHAPAAVLDAVIDLLELQSVAATTGAVRTEALFHLRTTGLQFLDVTLPPSARLLSLLVDQSPRKPVEGRPGEVRVELPSKQNPAATTLIRILYEDPATKPWRAAGRGKLHAPRLSARIPILKTTWNAYVPDGFHIADWEGDLAPLDQSQPYPLILAPLAFWEWRQAIGAMAVLGSSGIADPRAIDHYEGGIRRGSQWYYGVRDGHARFGERSDFAPAKVEKDWDLHKAWDRPVRRQYPDLTALTPIPRPRDPEKDRAQRLLEQIIIPKLEFREAGVTDALDFLRQKSVQLQQVRPGETPRGLAFQSKFDPAKFADVRITVSLVSIPLGEALKYVTNLAGLKYRVIRGGVEIHPQGTPTDELVTKEYKTVPRFLGGSQRPDVKDLLIPLGMQFPTGSEATYLADASRLLLRNTEEQIDYFDALVESSQQPRRTAEDESDKVTGRAQTLHHKLNTILIPKLEFREATIREAVDFLKQQSFALDTAEPDPAKRGVNIVLRLEEPLPGTIDPAQARITVSLTNIPLVEALRYVTGLANLKFKVEPYAVSIVPQGTPTETLMTKEWRLPDSFLRGLQAKESLSARGVTFPPGSAAIFLPSSSRLIVKNTQENLDLIDGMVEAGIETTLEKSATAGRIGLLPMELELPRAGKQIVFEGQGPPGEIEFTFAEAGSRARRLWLWLVAGGVLALFFSGPRPWWRTAWVALLLSAIPLGFAPSTTAIWNALLAGWLLSIVAQRLALRFVFSAPRAQEKEALA